jgi:hypothetical protein
VEVHGTSANILKSSPRRQKDRSERQPVVTNNILHFLGPIPVQNAFQSSTHSLFSKKDRGPGKTRLLMLLHSSLTQADRATCTKKHTSLSYAYGSQIQTLNIKRLRGAVTFRITCLVIASACQWIRIPSGLRDLRSKLLSDKCTDEFHIPEQFDIQES